MYEGLNKLLALKGMGLAEDSSGMKKAFRLQDLIPLMAAQRLDKMSVQSVPPVPQLMLGMTAKEGNQVKAVKEEVPTPKNIQDKPVEAGSYVFSAHDVANFGNGNTIAGAKILYDIFSNSNNNNGTFSGLVNVSDTDGMEDDITFEVIGDPNLDYANLSNGEFVVDRKDVANYGDGDTDKGSEFLTKVRKDIRKLKTGKTSLPTEIDGMAEANKRLREV